MFRTINSDENYQYEKHLDWVSRPEAPKANNKPTDKQIQNGLKSKEQQIKNLKLKVKNRKSIIHAEDG